MKKYFILFCLLVIMTSSVFAQNVGISDVAITPDPSSMLEVRSTTKGMLIPRLALVQTSSAVPVTSPAVSLLVFNTATVNDVTPGFYYWSGSAWVRLLSGIVPTSGWALTGNAGTNPTSNFLGTTDAQDFVIRTNNTERIRVFSSGAVRLGHGTAATDAFQVGGYGFANPRVFMGSEGGAPGYGIIRLQNLAATNTVIIRGTGVTEFSGGNVGVGLPAPAEQLDVLNNIRAGGIVYWGGSGSRSEVRDNAGLFGVSARSGFFETTAPAPAANWPTGATGWWHLLDIRHSNTSNNYAMQLAGSFYDQSLYFRKTNNNAAQQWTKVMTTAEYASGITYDYSTSSMTAPISSMSIIPGMQRTLNLQAGDIVYLHAHGGVMAAGINWAAVEFGIRVNGVDLPNGGYTKVSVDYDVAFQAFANWAISGHYPVPVSGSYTFAVFCGRFGGNGNASVGGDNTTVTQGSLRIEVVRPNY